MTIRLPPSPVGRHARRRNLADRLIGFSTAGQVFR
jgi:hypothetical protein